MNNIVELMGQLANTEERTKTSRKIAKTLGAETVFIFVKDDELGMLLPAQGFAQTITCMQSWQPFIKKCLKNKFHKGALHYPDETTTKSAVAISYRNELVFLLIGGKPDTNKLNEVTDLLPLVASMLKHELYKSQTEVQLKIAEKSLLTNNEVVSKLYATRHELRTSLALLRQETEARQTTEKELSNQQKLLHELFMQAPAVIAVLQGSNHTFKLANPLYKKLIGGREVVGRTVKQALPELAGQGIYELLDKVYKTGKPFIGNEVLVKLDKQSNGVMQDGYYNFVYQPSRDGKNKVTGILIHAIDVTEQVIARQKVQASEEQLRFMAESMPQKIFMTTPEGKIDYLNPQWEEFTGQEFKKNTLWRWNKFVHPEDLQTTKANWKKSLTSGEPFQQENRFKQKDGTYRLHLNRAHALRDNEGQIVMWIGSSTDIEDVTQAVVRKDQLELLTAGLKEQRKQLLALNNAKDEFIALASHQLRTPATAVKQYISLMLEGYASPVTSTQKAYLQTAYDSNERQLNIINDLLKTAEIDSSGYTLRRESYNVANLLNEIIAELQPNLRYKQQSAIFKDESDQTAILIDVNEMKIALSNLLENASKYSHNDSTIHIKLLRKNGKLLIEIKDEGVGLKQGDTRRIFDKFTRVNNELSDTVSGTGLGLYWVKQIIKLHGGSVNVRSILGKGSTFIVSLPI